MPGAARAYDVVNAIRRAALKCGTSSDQIRDCLRQVAFVGDSGPFEFDIERNFKVTATPSRLYEVRNGKITSLE